MRNFEDGQSGEHGTNRPNSARRINNVNKNLVTQYLVELIIF
jgi:hypothetical protein